jgi:glucan 1,3-beta-glucosidase
MIDLHGAPGSQNGYDNSGRRGQALFATDGNNVNRAKNVIQTLSEKYSDPSYYRVVTSLCLLNEPATYLNDQLLQTTRQYWKDAYGAGRYPWAPQGSASKSGLALIISDGFQPLSTFNGFMTEPNFETVLIDTHNYQVFDNTQNAWDWPTHLRVSPYTATGADSSKSVNEATPTGTHLYGLSSVNGHWPIPIALST